MKKKSIYKPLADKRSFHNLIYAMLQHRDRMYELDWMLRQLPSKKTMIWADRCRYAKALNERNFLYEEIRLVLLESGANKQRAARLARRFVWHGKDADLEQIEQVYAKMNQCKCAFSG